MTRLELETADCACEHHYFEHVWPEPGEADSDGSAPCSECGCLDFTEVEIEPELPPEKRVCRECSGEYVVGYEHKHHRPPDTSWTPMARMPTSLEELLAEARREYLAELPLRLHGRLVDDPDAAGPAPDWTRAFRRRMGISFFEGEWTLSDEDYAIFLMESAIQWIGRGCRLHHARRPDHRGRPVCWTLVRHVVEGRYGIPEAALADDVQLSPERAEQYLREALVEAWKFRRDIINDWRGRRLSRPRADAAA